MEPWIVLILLGGAALVGFYPFIIDSWKEFSEYYEKNKRVLPGSRWKEKPCCFDDEEDPFVIYPIRIAEVIEVLPNKNGVKFVKYKTGWMRDENQCEFSGNQSSARLDVFCRDYNELV